MMKNYHIKMLRDKSKSLEDCTYETVSCCYVSAADKTIIARYSNKLKDLNERDGEKYLEIIRKSISGAIGTKLFEVSTEDADTQYLLTNLVDDFSSDLLDSLYQKIISSYETKVDYVIVAVNNTVDIQPTDDDGQPIMSADFRYPYFIASTCPVTNDVLALAFDKKSKEFHSRILDNVASAPAFAFTFPSLESKEVDNYHAILYSATKKAFPECIVKDFFGADPKTVDVYNNSMSLICNIFDKSGVIRDNGSENLLNDFDEKVHDFRIARKHHSEEPLVKEDFLDLCRKSGFQSDDVAALFKAWDDVMEEAEEKKQKINPFRLNKVAPVARKTSYKIQKSDKAPELKTRLIDGVEYLLVPVSQGVLLNGHTIGVNVQEGSVTDDSDADGDEEDKGYVDEEENLNVAS